MDNNTWLYIVLGVIVAGAVISVLRRRRAPVEPPSLDRWILEQTSANPDISLGKLLDRYIAKYNVCLRATLDEPAFVTDARTKLQLIQTSVFANPEACPDPQLEKYVFGLYVIVTTWDSVSPETREAIRQNPPKLPKETRNA